MPWHRSYRVKVCHEHHGRGRMSSEDDCGRRRSMLKANYHTHTVFCDGDNTAQEMVDRALELGFEHLGF